jgi:kynurenine formamidase
MHDVIDLSHRLSSSGGSFCDGHPRYSCEPFRTIEGDGSAVSYLSLSSHTGTHIDAPAHFIAGAATVDAIDLSQLVSPAVVIDARGHAPNSMLEWDPVFAPHEMRFQAGTAVLVCTGWSKHWGTNAYSRNPYVSPEAARRIADRGVRVLGIDALSPDGIPGVETSEVAKHEVHEVWLGRGGVIAENLNNLESLLEDEAARWVVSLLPLRLDRCDGSPVRAVAWRQ